jgi:hypothetical protein
VDEDKLRTGPAAHRGPQVHPEGQLYQHPLNLLYDMFPGPFVARVREPFLAGGFGPAAAGLVVGRHRLVVIARYTRCPPLLQEGDRHVGPWGVADQVPEVVGGPTSSRLSMSANTASRAWRFEWTSGTWAYFIVASVPAACYLSQSVYTCSKVGEPKEG